MLNEIEIDQLSDQAIINLIGALGGEAKPGDMLMLAVTIYWKILQVCEQDYDAGEKLLRVIAKEPVIVFNQLVSTAKEDNGN